MQVLTVEQSNIRKTSSLTILFKFMSIEKGLMSVAAGKFFLFTYEDFKIYTIFFISEAAFFFKYVFKYLSRKSMFQTKTIHH